MKMQRVAALALGAAFFLGGCTTVTDDRSQTGPAMAGGRAVPKESVAAERCSESYRTRSSQQGAFFRSVIC